MKKLSSKLLAGLVLGSVLMTGTAFAAEESVDSFDLDQIVVTAQRTETKDLTTAAALTVITAEDIEMKGATTITEALRMTAGITDTSYNGNGDDFGSSQSRVYLRGFDKGALVLLNGAPINIFNYASLSGIPVEAVERIEVVRGAQSVLYGSEAMGGVINVITKSGNGKQKTTLSGTAGNYLKKASVTVEGEGYVATIGKDYIHRYDRAQIRPKYTTPQYRDVSKYTKDNAFISLDLSKNLKFNYIYNQMDPMYTNRLFSTGKQTGNAYRYKDTKNLASLIYTDKENQTRTVLAYNVKKCESENISTAGKISRTDSSNYEASNLFLDSQKKWDFGKDSLIAGVNLKREKYDQLYANSADNSRTSYGAYISYTKVFSDKFNAIIGVRGQRYEESDWDGSNHALTPQLQTVYKINDNSSWYTNIGKAFEMPAVNSHTSAGGTSADIVRKNSVKPEEGWNYETGYKRITDSSAFKVAAFYMDYKNKFAWKNFDWLPSDKNKIQVNIGKFENKGVEIEYAKKVSDKFSYNLNATFQDPISKDEGVKTQESARIILNGGVDYKVGKFKSNINCSYYLDRENSYYDWGGATLGKKSPHRLTDRIKLNASMSYAPADNHKFVLNMYNLLDRHDYVSTYDYRDLPFNWTLTYQISF
ncbi:MAG: TonB-dependent receptor [Phascolarctobacterium sp.]|nr:TonB-dependent receptor [Phascolarctobacterium sp.]